MPDILTPKCHLHPLFCPINVRKFLYILFALIGLFKSLLLFSFHFLKFICFFTNFESFFKIIHALDFSVPEFGHGFYLVPDYSE